VGSNGGGASVVVHTHQDKKIAECGLWIAEW
jgi:hypothetical protein